MSSAMHITAPRSLSVVREVPCTTQPSTASGRFAHARVQASRTDSAVQRGNVVAHAAVDGERPCLIERAGLWPAMVQPRPALRKARERFRHAVTPMLRRMMELLQSAHKDPVPFFTQGVNEPVRQEVFSRNLEVVQGAVPPELAGMYIRTGPNAQHVPKGGYVMVDGEAMLHGVRFENGQALSYCNHWLRCPRFVHEKEQGENIYIRIGDIRGFAGLALLALTQQFPWMFPEPDEYLNYQLGNTSLCWHNGRLLALMEGGMPFQAHIGAEGEVASVGPYDFNGAMTSATSGHPKVCPITGEMHSFFYRVTKTAPDQHLCVYHKVSPDGVLSQDYPVNISRGQMMHDFAITERHAVFCDAAVAFNPLYMITQNGLPFENDTVNPSRIGLLDRGDPSKPLRWFKTETPFSFFHTANAWEEEDGSKLHLVLCRFESLNVSQGLVKGFVEDVPEVCRFTIDLEGGEVDEDGDIVGAVQAACLVPGRAADFPVVPQELLGRKHRFCYAAVADDTAADCGGACCSQGTSEEDAQKSTKSIIKVDMWADEGNGLLDAEGRRREIMFGDGVIGGEATFVARDSDAMLRGECAEDDGFLVVYVTDTNASDNAADMESFCMVYDAQTMSSEPLAKIRMPQRVPLGLHGAFVSADKLAQQAPPAHLMHSDFASLP
eukprot:jgi/Ulvmu1/3825/UM018_0036.1